MSLFPLTLYGSLSLPHTPFPMHTPNLSSQSIPDIPQDCRAIIVSISPLLN